jgi:hypothetical protein
MSGLSGLTPNVPYQKLIIVGVSTIFRPHVWNRHHLAGASLRPSASTSAEQSDCHAEGAKDVLTWG